MVRLTRNSDEIGFDALYVRSRVAFDRIDEATLLLDDPGRDTAAGPDRGVYVGERAGNRTALMNRWRRGPIWAKETFRPDR